jgi:hypothetical protein
MKIQNWDMSAGGVCARDDKHGYSKRTDIGTYFISPISSRYNVNRHVGYLVQFANDRGMIDQAGLWRDLSVSPRYVNLREAYKLCNSHFSENSR